MKPLQVKIIYHPTNETAKLALDVYLAPMEQRGFINIMDKEDDISDLFNDGVDLTPDLAFILLSPELLADKQRELDYINAVYTGQKEKEVYEVYPILVKSCSYEYKEFYTKYIKSPESVYPRPRNSSFPIAADSPTWEGIENAFSHIMTNHDIPNKGKGRNLSGRIDKIYAYHNKQANRTKSPITRFADPNIKIDTTGVNTLSRPGNYQNEPDEQNEGMYNPGGQQQNSSSSNTGTGHNNTGVRSRVLFMTANPQDTQAIQVTKEYKEVDTLQHVMDKAERFEVKMVHNTTTQEFMRHIMAEQPKILHFSGHGTGQAGLIFHDGNDNAQFANSQALSTVFSLFKGVIDCVLLNACYSLDQAQAIAQYVPYVIGTTQEVADSKAITFTRGFYTACFSGMSFEQSFTAGKAQILMEGLPEGAEIMLLKEGKVIA
ncbi:MAG: CHAT domain-containing protein [Aureispira sp.]|nr:CHAT domain-containing protein [Aureispira sp.]